MSKLKGFIKDKSLVLLVVLSICISLVVPQIILNGSKNISEASKSNLILIGLSDVVYAAEDPDFYCDGTEDNVQFQLAINALSDSGGEIRFEPGDYVFTGTVTRAIDNITITGMGKGSSITLDGSTAIFSSGSQDGWVFQNFSTDAGGLTYTLANNCAVKGVWVNDTYLVDLPAPESSIRPASCIVAASDASASILAQADYVCDGTADEVQINAALTAWTGGKVLLSEGTFVVAEGQSIEVPSSTELCGSGWGTIVKAPASCATYTTLITNTGAGGTGNTNVIVRDLYCDGDDDGGATKPTAGVTFDTVTGGQILNCKMDDMSSTGVSGINRGTGIAIDNSSQILVQGNEVSNCGHAGIRVHNGSSFVTVLSNFCHDNDSEGIAVACRTAAGNVSYGEECTDVNVKDNIVKDNSQVENVGGISVDDYSTGTAKANIHKRINIVGNIVGGGYVGISTWMTVAEDDIVSLIAEVLDDTETDIDVDDGTEFAAGAVIRIDLEEMYVVSISTNTLTVTRGYNESVAEPHADDSAIELVTDSHNLIEANIISGTLSSGISIKGFYNTSVLNNSISDVVGAGITISNIGSVFVVGNKITGTGAVPLLISGSPESKFDFNLINGKEIQTAITIAGASTDVSVSNNTIYTSHTRDGIYVAGTSTGSNISGNTIYMQGHTTENDSGKAIYVGTTASYATVQNNTFVSKSVTSGSCWIKGIELDADYCTVKGNRTVTSGSNDFFYGLDINSGSDSSVVEENDFTIISSAAIVNDGSSNVIRFNQGYVTENTGSSSIASGTTTKVVAHGCSSTPTVIIVTFSEQGTNDYGRFWVDTIGAANFTLNVSADPGASNLDFSWEALVR